MIASLENNERAFSLDRITLFFLIKCFISAFFLSLYVDVFSLSEIGTVISYILFCTFVISAFIAPITGCKYFLILMLVIPKFPLNILDVFEALQVDQSLQYETITYSSIAGFPMYQIIFLIFSILFLMRMKTIRICFPFTIFAGIMLFPTLLHFWAEPETFMVKEVATTLRYPFYLFVGWIIYWYFSEREKESTLISMILEIFVCTALILVFQSIFHLFRVENFQTLSIGLNPQITLPLLLALVILHRRCHIPYGVFILLCILLLFSLFSPARWDMIIMFFSFVVFFVMTKRFVTGFCLGILIIVALSLTFCLLQHYNSRLADFYSWKLMDFSLAGALSDSGELRIFELRNIIAQNGYNPFYWLLGKGGSAYFTFQNYTPVFFHMLDLKSYQYYELENGIFYHPHMFVNWLLLKFGLIGLFTYIYIQCMIFLLAARLFTQRNLLKSNEFCFVVLALFFSIPCFLASLFDAVYTLLSMLFFMLLKNLNKNIRNIKCKSSQHVMCESAL